MRVTKSLIRGSLFITFSTFDENTTSVHLNNTIKHCWTLVNDFYWVHLNHGYRSWIPDMSICPTLSNTKRVTDLGTLVVPFFSPLHPLHIFLDSGCPAIGLAPLYLHQPCFESDFFLAWAGHPWNPAWYREICSACSSRVFIHSIADI